MYVKIRRLFKSSDGDVIINISKMALIQELRQFVFEETKVEISKQRLFYKGKQLTDDHTVMDYNIQLNDVIQLMIKDDQTSEGLKESNVIEVSAKPSTTTDENGELRNATEEPVRETGISQYYKINDAVDTLHKTLGYWTEASITDIFKSENIDEDKENNKEPGILFCVECVIDGDKTTEQVSFNEIRPRAKYTYKKSELSVGNEVMVNYNIDKPSTRGYWYDFIIKNIKTRNLIGTLIVGKQKTKIENRSIKYINEVMRIESVPLLKDRPEDFNLNLPASRKTFYYCDDCEDNVHLDCKSCGCFVCHKKHNPEMIVLCDECDDGYHMNCIEPPLQVLPTDDWYCPKCKRDANEIVKAGDKLKFSYKKSKMASSKQNGNSRDWGRGMACVGRTKECTIVKKNHFGPLPGVEVGTTWKYRLQVSEAGIHRPHVAGIHGREVEGAYSLILSGGYEDDIDNGNEFLYSGSGGRDLSGNKRVSQQSCDQELTRMNKALALNCNVPLNKNGAEAVDWKAGKPVRVVRNYKLQLKGHSKYAPKDGNRYDGIYKVVKYYPEKGKSGYVVWKYLLRRDDPEPAPWDDGGQELEMLYPPGYLEAEAKKESALSAASGSKRKSTNNDDTKKIKKTKVVPYKLTEKILKNIGNDKPNAKLWDECKAILKDGKQAFLSKVEELFMCICCQELVCKPITTPCTHNFCNECLKRAIIVGIASCPYCRFELGNDFKPTFNKDLESALQQLFPGYENNR